MAIYSGFTTIYPLQMVIFHSFFVCLPEGIWIMSLEGKRMEKGSWKLVLCLQIGHLGRLDISVMIWSGEDIFSEGNGMLQTWTATIR